MKRRTLQRLLIDQATLVLFALVLVLFGILAPSFLTLANFQNILVQSASTGILAVGMTLVLLTAGVDLSVGAIMFVAGAIGGRLVLDGWPLPSALAVMLAIGLVYGLVNALFIVQLRIMAFIVTLATLYFGRGLGLWLTETRAMNLPQSFYDLGAESILGIPIPVITFLAIAVLAHLALGRTPFGRHLYAVGNDRDAARKAGLPVRFIETAAYALCGLCAAAAAIVSLTQAPAVSPGFGSQREFAAIAAAVLGGTSLFGGKGNILPGTVLGAVLIQTIQAGLNILNVDPYLYPLITSAIIFVAVLIDTLRARLQARLGRRKIRLD